MRNVRKGSSELFCGLVNAFVTALALIVVHAQPNQFQFIVGAVDANGTPVTDLKANEVVMTENGAPATVLKIEPYKVPVKLTVAVDNGPDSRDALSHYRSGLKGLVEALHHDGTTTLPHLRGSWQVLGAHFAGVSLRMRPSWPSVIT